MFTHHTPHNTQHTATREITKSRTFGPRPTQEPPRSMARRTAPSPSRFPFPSLLYTARPSPQYLSNTTPATKNVMSLSGRVRGSLARVAATWNAIFGASRARDAILHLADFLW